MLSRGDGYKYWEIGRWWFLANNGRQWGRVRDRGIGHARVSDGKVS